MLLQINNGTLMAGGEIVLQNFHFEIKGQEKIAVIGSNGTGKTTLLKLLAGELYLARDDKRQESGIYTARNISIGILHQNPYMHSLDITLEEEIMQICPVRDTWEKERFEFEMEYDRYLTQFGFSKEDKKKKLNQFSGGEKTKLALIKLLLQKPDLMLLDEPTNHLDEEMIIWLEDYIKNYKKAVVMVSHDRFFLDQTAMRIYEICDKKMVSYVGNYSAYRREKQKNYEIQLKKYRNQQEEIKRLNDNINKFKTKPRKAAFARSRKKILERMEYIEEPKLTGGHIFTGELLPERMGNKIVLEAEDLQIGYEHMLQTLSLRIRRGQKIAVIGPNGIGKSTFLKTVMEEIPPIKGSVKMGDQIDLAYFDQDSANVETEESLFDDFMKTFPAFQQKDARSYLASFLFSADQMHQSIHTLSGGEKARFILAKLLCRKPNFMILDEPTNHMDISAKETLESAFLSYKGTVLFVSHDRYFVSQLADALLIFGKNTVTYYPFGYQHYIEHINRVDDDQERLPGELSSEDQMMVDSLKAVPQKSSLLSHEWSKERLYRDWKLRLATEDLISGYMRLADVIQSAQENYMKESFCLLGESYHFVKETGGYEEQILENEDDFHNACLAWYDAWLECEAANEL